MLLHDDLVRYRQPLGHARLAPLVAIVVLVRPARPDRRLQCGPVLGIVRECPAGGTKTERILDRGNNAGGSTARLGVGGGAATSGLWLTRCGRACLARLAEDLGLGAETLPKAMGRPVSGSMLKGGGVVVLLICWCLARRLGTIERPIPSCRITSPDQLQTAPSTSRTNNQIPLT